MSHSQEVSVSFCHERCRPGAGSALSAVAHAATRMVAASPFHAHTLPFFEAAGACDWLANASERLCADLTRADAPLPHRLRAIKLGAEVLVEHTYSKDGMIESTRFSDGTVVGHARDECARRVRLSLGATRSVEQRFRPDGSPESITYAGGKRFDFGYDDAGRLAEFRYPDGVTVTFSHEATRPLARVTVGETRFGLDWSSSGELDGCSVEAGGAKQELRFDSGSIAWPCRALAAAQGGPSAPHPLGIWVADGASEMSELITALGDRWVISEAGPHGPRRVWTPAGQAEYEYDSAGVLSAVVAPDGSRSVFHGVSGQRNTLLISANAVTLFAYAPAGLLSKIHETSGSFSLFRRGRGGLVSRIDTLRGKTRLGWNLASQLASIAWPGGLKCDLARGDTGGLQSLVIHRLAPHSAWRLKELSAGLWSWLADRPALRLEDAVWRGEKGARL